MANIADIINKAWEDRANLDVNSGENQEILNLINYVIEQLELGKISVAEKQGDNWVTNQWIKKAVLLYFKFSENITYENGVAKWFDKVPVAFKDYTREDFMQSKIRLVPGSYVRKGAYLAENTVIMPSFVNIGAYVGSGTLIDTWATVGACAYVGKNCHISGGTGIGGVLEPLQANPTIIEDDCFIGARSEIAEGVIVEQGSVISMGVFLGASTKIVDRHTGEISYGKIPPYSVVVPGSLPAEKPGLPSLYCAIIVKQVDAKTRSKTSINDLLRYS